MIQGLEMKKLPVIFISDHQSNDWIRYPIKPNSMNWNAIFGIACIVSLTAPIAVIIYHRYYQHRSLAALLANYTITLLYLLMSQNLLPVSNAFRINFGILDNFLDVPLMLTALVFFCPNKSKQNMVRMLSYIFVGYIVLITCIRGYRVSTIVYILGPGLLIIISYTLFLFVRQTKFSILHGKNHGRVLMLAAIFFSYACYALIFYFFYIQQTPEVNDTEILYFISTGVSALAMAIGLQLMNKRMKELQALRVTRKELAMFFNH